jgi:hypothetical protein
MFGHGMFGIGWFGPGMFGPGGDEGAGNDPPLESANPTGMLSMGKRIRLRVRRA